MNEEIDKVAVNKNSDNKYLYKVTGKDMISNCMEHRKGRYHEKLGK